ncbi:MAG: D-glycero-beta-D-manno-heptose 1-phosphate adenylyltransferase [Desulfobulbus sp.]|jgi:rfaE bifunctional protein nucleotidyltransferase chain/domain|uniref:D-glycero-beta-D-manno-heptose 1-phosphate adenylyltransferase n=1 Tax=Desulfobulbus sp. TaxID=895 RepID=UPI00284A5948|nr:D-glycero-beta-D-manno-heptose 1-phosphate adenylyltransferase [Desulfobulbus sp.]MDR2549648.1 D-glycero-beta-D-manno-heptose 1-phosphate adenylyltransferase [Desulfobulbus sp.]
MTAPPLFPAVACVQFAIALGAVERNLKEAERLIDRFKPTPGTLLVLPEMWATGFDYERTTELGQRAPEILAAMQRIASRYGVYVAGTLTDPADDGGLPANTLAVVGPQGVIGRTAKQHLFAHWQEDRYYRGGEAAPPIRTPHGPLAGLVCYDLRFPEVARRLVFAGGRLLAVSAEWPLSRVDHWQTLVRARAIENQVFVAAANGCGRTGVMEMAGHSMIVAPDGTVMQAAGTVPMVIGCPLDNNLIDEQRRRFYAAGDQSWSAPDCGKIRSLEALRADLALVRHQGSRVAFTNGCFDILHAGHVSYLEAARRTADCLVVGLNTDDSVRGLKGPGRPMNTEADRARVLAALGCVDFVVLFAEATPMRLITALMPDVLVKGADYREEQIVGAPEVKAAGGRVVRIAFEHDRSTTGLIDRIRTSS